MVVNPILHSRTENFELDLYFVLDQVVNKQVYASHIPSIVKMANTFTKPISQPQFMKFCSSLRVYANSNLEFKGDDRDIST